MKRATIIFVGLLVLALGHYAITVDYDETVENVVSEYVPEQRDAVDIKADEIYNSAEFQSEMRTMALARAQFEISIEKQSEALELSLQAQTNYDKAQSLESKWHDDKTVE